jgi:hypothetical protein
MSDTPTQNQDTNEMTSSGKFWAGVQLIIVTSVVIFFIIAYWPNKMPSLKDGDDAAWYHYKLFNMNLIEASDSSIIYSKDSLHKIVNSIEKNISQLKDTSRTRDSAAKRMNDSAIKKLNDSLAIVNRLITNIKTNNTLNQDACRIHLNTLLLILVALTGFLGNMIHIASSLTNFIGNGTFKRNWVLWYYVKPITASGLAIIVYFIIRAGFLSYGTGASGISLYGILSLSAFAGLFTDSATLKLQEIFEVIFKPKDDRQDKLADPVIGVTGISVESIPPAIESTIKIKGANLDTQGIKITLDGNVVKASKVLKDEIEVKYTPTATAAAAGKTVLVLSDKNGKAIFTKEIIIN